MLPFNPDDNEKISGRYRPLKSELVKGKILLLAGGSFCVIMIALFRKNPEYTTDSFWIQSGIICLCALIAISTYTLIKYRSDRKNEALTEYIITDRRIVFCEPDTVFSVPFKDISHLYVSKKFRKRRTMYGNILIAVEKTGSADTAYHVLYGIENIDAAFNLIEDACTQRQIITGTGLFDTDAVDSAGNTHLLQCIAAGKSDKAILLIENGADANRANKAGITPLIAAVKNNMPGLVSSLLDYSADPDLIDESGRTARDYAHEFSDTSMRDIINNR